MTGKGVSARWLIIVQSDRRDLYSDLRRNFKPDKRVDVILDRRRGERRLEDGPVASDRRRQPRRRPLTADQFDLWETVGFRLYYRDEEMRVYEKTRKKPVNRRTPRIRKVRARLGPSGSGPGR
jgi:hypothetical protein